MNDLLFIIKICIGAINILLAIEIACYLFANRKDRLKKLRVSKNQPTATFKIALGFFCLFLLSTLSFLFFILEIRFNYYYPIPPSNIKEMTHLLHNLENICFIYAFTWLFCFLESFLTRIKFQIPIITGICIWSFILLILDWGLNLNAYIVILLAILPLIVLFKFIQMTKEKLRKQFGLLFFGFIVFLSGWATMTQLYPLFPQFVDYSGPEILIFGSLILMGYGFLSIPSFNEPFAASFVEELHITTTNGRIILRQQFNMPQSDLNFDIESDSDEGFFASSIVGIDGLLREISTAQLLKTFVHQDKILIVEGTSQLLGLLVTRMDLKTLRSQLLKVLKEIDSNFLAEIQMQENLNPMTESALIKMMEKEFKKDIRKKGILSLKF